MLKKDDKDGIIAYLKGQLERIQKLSVKESDRYSSCDQIQYVDVVCPECECEFEAEVEFKQQPDDQKYIHEDVMQQMRDIAEKAIAEASF